MNLKNLQTFVKVVELRGFTGVADAMNLTQSGVSRQIKALEEEIGVQLLTRSSASLQLTAAGELVYAKAKRLLGEWDELLAECLALKNEWSGQLRLGASTIPACYLLPPLIKAFQDKFPRIEFTIRTGDSREILTLLESRQLDLAFVGQKTENPELLADCFATDRLVLIGQAPSRTTVSLQDAARLPLIVRETGSGTRKAVELALTQAGIDIAGLNVMAEVNSTEAALAMVEAGVGYTFVSRWAVRGTGRQGLNVVLELPTERCFYLISHQVRQSHPLIKLFKDEALARKT